MLTGATCLSYQSADVGVLNVFKIQMQLSRNKTFNQSTYFFHCEKLTQLQARQISKNDTWKQYIFFGKHNYKCQTIGMLIENTCISTAKTTVYIFTTQTTYCYNTVFDLHFEYE